MHFVNQIGLLFAALVITTVAQATEVATIHSPDQQLAVLVDLDEQGQLSYQVQSGSDKVIEPSLLGITLNNTDFTKKLRLLAVKQQPTVNDSYQLFTGKQQFVDYQANSTVVSVTNQQHETLNVRFQVSNDGVAFRYELDGESSDTRVVMSEQTGFNFPSETVAWLQPKAQAQSGWMNTNPSYEEEYLQATALTTPAITNNGWVYPALFKHQEQYILISEAGGEDYYSGTNLTNN
ncbi:glycoside hydrolase family 97 N-terminal domain-containing protein, partial [Pseudoalteromonas tetraodonis]